jgi:D-ribulokinase
MTVTLGIDFGTSGVRAIALDLDGQSSPQTPGPQILAQVRLNYQPAEGSVDRAASWRLTLEQVMESLPPEVLLQIRAIALAGTSATTLLCDADGQPLTPARMYNDAVSPEVVADLRTRVGAYCQNQHFQNQQIQNQQVQQDSAIAPDCSVALSATASLAKLWAWKTQPEFQPLHHRARYFLHQADWLAGWLHGRWGLSDYHNALKLGYDVQQLRYPDWMGELGIAAWLPQVVAPGSAVAPLRPELAQRWGLTDCQVCGGTTDSIAAFLASGCNQPGSAVTSLGSTLVLKLLSQRPVNHPGYGIYSHRLDLGNEVLWLVGGASNSGGAVLRHFFSDAEIAQLSLRLDPHTPTGLNYYPLLQCGERFPHNDPTWPPQLEPRPSSDAQFLQGLMEGIATIEALGYRLLQAEGASALTQVYTAGGGAQNPVWTQLRSQQLGVRVEAAPQTEAAYGAAVLASWGLV